MPTIDELMDRAKERCAALDLTEESFEVKDLFDPFEWSSLPKGIRQTLGRHFSEDVASGKVPNVVKEEKLKGNRHNRYYKART